jgi:hypothetical protein
VKYSGQLQTKLNSLKEFSTVLPKYHRTCLFHLTPLFGMRKNYGSEALTLLLLLLLISAYYVFWTLRNHPLSNRIYELFTLKMCLSTLEQSWPKNTSIEFEHWPLYEIPTLRSYMISQESSAVTSLGF